MIDPDLSYWDVAALIPVVEGAGGVITSTSGGTPLKEKSAVCTAGGALHEEVLRALNA
jgi:myo-inositol-1(or 4)-monophosphatase